MVLILGKNVWTDNAGAHGCKKQQHLRTRGKDEVLGRNNITWSLYDSLPIMKKLQRRSHLISYIEIWKNHSFNDLLCEENKILEKL